MTELERVFEVLSLRGLEVKINHRRTDLVFKFCPFCQNPNWNFEVELTEKFVYHCWACGESGRSETVLRKVFLVDVVVPEHIFERRLSKSSRIWTEEEDSPLVFREPPNWRSTIRDESLVSLVERNRPLIRVIGPESRFFWKGQRVRRGLVIRGLKGRGQLVVDLERETSFRTRKDIFGLNLERKSRLFFVEGFFDVLSFFRDRPTIILTQSFIEPKFISSVFDLLAPKELHFCLDQGVSFEKIEKKLKRDIRCFSVRIFFYSPEKHSPRESSYLLLKKII